MLLLFYRLFGLLLFLSLCEFEFIMMHFKFMKTVVGKGFFNIFCSAMYLVGNDESLTGYAMMGGLAACGVFFILVGCTCIKTKEGEEKKAAKKVNGAAKDDVEMPLNANNTQQAV